MREEAEFALLRYEAMADMLDRILDAVIALAERDRASYGTAYVLPPRGHGVAVTSNVLREVCGLTYDESVAAIAEREPIDSADWLKTTRTPEEWARFLDGAWQHRRSDHFDMEIVKAKAAGFPEAVEKIDAAIAVLKGMRFVPLYDGKQWKTGE